MEEQWSRPSVEEVCRPSMEEVAEGSTWKKSLDVAIAGNVGNFCRER